MPNLQRYKLDNLLRLILISQTITTLEYNYFYLLPNLQRYKLDNHFLNKENKD